jgi:hypothetical protein
MSALHVQNGLNLGTKAGQIPSLTVSFAFTGPIQLSQLNNGQCGGFTWTVLDFFQAEPRLLMRPDAPPAGAKIGQVGEPPPFTPLFDYIVQRQLDSMAGFTADMFAYNAFKYMWFLIIPLHDTQLSGSFAPHGVAWSMINQEIPAIMNDVNAGMLSPLSLVATDITSGHQVLVWGYDLDDSDNLTLWVYDPNEPNVDIASIQLNINDPGGQTLAINWGAVGAALSGTTFRGFFREAYSTSDALGVMLVAAVNVAPAFLGELQPLAPSWNAWESFGSPPGGVDLQSLYATYVAGSQALDPLGTSPATSPAVCSWGPGRLDVFIQDSDSFSDHFTWDNGPQGWENLGQSLLSYPAATSWADGRLDVFGVLGDTNYSMGHRSFDNGAWTPNWESLGFPDGNWDGTPVPLDGSANSAAALEYMHGAAFLSRPSACSWGPQRLDLFAVAGHRNSGDSGQITDTDGNIYHAIFNTGEWSPWVPVPRTFSILPGSALAACSWGVGRLDIFAISAVYDNPGEPRVASLKHNWYTVDDAGNGTWSAWEDLGAPPVAGFNGTAPSLTFGSPLLQPANPSTPSSPPTFATSPPSPAAGTWGENRLDVFAIGGDGQLWHIWYDGQWHAWENIGGMIQADPCCVSWAPGRLDVFAPASDFALWHVWFQG